VHGRVRGHPAGFLGDVRFWDGGGWRLVSCGRKDPYGPRLCLSPLRTRSNYLFARLRAEGPVAGQADLICEQAAVVKASFTSNSSASGHVEYSSTCFPDTL
jgi:hypothetical protein